MGAAITMMVVGIIVCILGVVNMTGNISSLHSYHTKRVSEENRKPFGKLVGLGTLIIGVALIIYGVLHLIFELTGMETLVVIGTAELIVGIVVGMAFSFYAMKKYNGGIF